MPKVRLDLDMLQVESFATQDAQAARGTVNGLQDRPENGEGELGTITVTTFLTRMETCRTCEAACAPTGEKYLSCHMGSICTSPCDCTGTTFPPAPEPVEP